MNFIRALTGCVVACLLAACGGGSSSSTPAPASTFSVSAKRDANAVAGFALTPGQTGAITAKTNQQLRFDSDAAVVWTVAANGASANVTQTDGTTWTAGLTTSIGGTVTLTATLAADSTKSASVVVTVQPVFMVTAKIGGTAVTNFSVTAGQNLSLDVRGGDTIELTSTDAVTWATSVPTVTSTTTTWSGSYDLKVGAATGTITILSGSSPVVSATVTLNVSPQRFMPTPRVLNDAISYTETDITYAATSSTIAETHKVNAVNSDGSYQQTVTRNGALTSVYSSDADGNRLSRSYTANDLCTYSPKRDTLDFPLYVGKAWSANWVYSCTAGYHEMAALSATVDAYESVTVPAGTFGALRVHYLISLTGSNDVHLTNGAAGTAAYQEDMTCWWAPSVNRTVKCSGGYTYTGTNPSNYLKSFVQQATFVGNQVSNALNGTYKVATALGSMLAVTVDLDAKTLNYSQNGTPVSGTLTASNGEWVLATAGNSVTGTRLVLKDGFVFGALPDRDSTGTWVAAPAAGARQDLVLTDTTQFAGTYYNLRFNPCLSTAASCVNDAPFPQQLSLVAVAGSTTQATASSCSVVPQSSASVLNVWLSTNPVTGCVGNPLSRTWTADSQGTITSSSVIAPNTFGAFFAKVNGKVTGFSTNKSFSGSATIGYGVALLLPVAANTASSYVGAGPVGLMNRTAKIFVQGDYSSTTGLSATLTTETGSGTFSIAPEAQTTGVATVNSDTSMALLSDGRFGAWFSASATTGGLSIALEMFK